MAFYLGLDSSTQGLSALAIEVDSVSGKSGRRRQVVLDVAVNFDEALPAYGTINGVLPHDDPRMTKRAISSSKTILCSRWE